MEGSEILKISNKSLNSYFKNLVNRFFKILPIKEQNLDTLLQYMESLQSELIGGESVVKELQAEPLYLTLIFILQRLIDNSDAAPKEFKREIFRAISICNKLAAKYGDDEVTV